MISFEQRMVNHSHFIVSHNFNLTQIMQNLQGTEEAPSKDKTYLILITHDRFNMHGDTMKLITNQHMIKHGL